MKKLSLLAVITISSIAISSAFAYPSKTFSKDFNKCIKADPMSVACVQAEQKIQDKKLADQIALMQKNLNDTQKQALDSAQKAWSAQMDADTKLILSMQKDAKVGDFKAQYNKMQNTAIRVFELKSYSK